MNMPRVSLRLSTRSVLPRQQPSSSSSSLSSRRPRASSGPGAPRHVRGSSVVVHDTPPYTVVSGPTTAVDGILRSRCIVDRHHIRATTRTKITTTTMTTAAKSLSTTTTSPPHHPFVLSHPSDVDHRPTSTSSSSSTSASPRRGRVVCITSGKGGVGKTTSAASFACGLALRGRPTCVVDFDMGLRNLDIHLGVERRVVFDFVHVLNGECNLNQALIPDRNVDGLYMLAASQTRDKDALTLGGVERVLSELTSRFEYVVLDSPAGIESGARHAMYFCDDAILVTNPELSSCRDADKMIGFISSRSRRAEIGQPGCLSVSQTLLITRYDPVRAEAEETLAITDMKELLGLPVIGVVPESRDVLTCTNLGKPVISLGEGNPAADAYMDMVDRFLGQEKELRFVTPEPVSFFKRIFG